MAKSALLTIDGTYRRIKSGYITVNSVYRKLKSAYITIGGVYRPCWGAGVQYYGAGPEMAKTAYYLAAASVGQYAIFAGGYLTSQTNVFGIVAGALGNYTANNLSYVRQELAATTLGNHAIFAGGRQSSSLGYGYVDAYDDNLTQTAPSSIRRCYAHAAATVGDIAIFAGGISDNGEYSYGEMFNSDLTLSTSTLVSLNAPRYDLAATTVGDIAIFAGGYSNINYSYSSVVDLINSEGTNVTQTSTPKLSRSRSELAATTVGNYAIFAGGYSSVYGHQDLVDVYDSTGTRLAADPLRVGRSGLAATTIGDFAIFAGGYGSKGTESNNYRSEVDVYDNYLTHYTPDTMEFLTDLSSAKYRHAATAIGGLAIFAGGYDGAGSVSKTTEVYTI